ncbi:MAG: hypothetical protein KAX31_06125, partial [Thermoplasmata archaeon]|nr:hypothetical protein [Thermoplasmata archaeon]
MASIVGFIGIGTAATEDKDSNEATGPIMISKDNLRKVEITTPEPLVPRVYPTITKTVGDPYPSPQAFPFQDADTTRCVLNELYATMDYGGLLPAIKGAYNDLDNGMYTTSEAFFMEWHADMEQILTPPPPPWNDTEYDPGHYMFVPPWSDSCARLLQPPPLGLDMTLWQILTGAGEYVPVPSAAVDGEIYEYPTIWYQDALEDTSAGSVGEVRRDDIVAMITPRLATETPVTIAVNGTFDDVTDWGNMTVTVAAIGDLPTTNIVVDFFIAEEHNSEIEVRNNPLTGNPPSEAWSNKNYYMNKVGRRWAGMGEPNAGGSFFLFNKTDTVTYVDVPFDDHWQWGGASMGWIGNNLWLLGVVINGDTGEVLQTSAFSIGNPTPDLYMTPVDIYTPTIGTVVNETAHGPTFDGEIGPIDLDNGNIIDCTLYIDLAGSEWLLLSEG